MRDLADNETDQRLVRGIVGLAREFHQTTTAEGVEDEATLSKLLELGVVQGQGYLFARPAPLTDAPGAGASHAPQPSAGDPDRSGSSGRRSTRSPLAMSGDAQPTAAG